MSRVKSYQIELVVTTNIKSFKTENNVRQLPIKTLVVSKIQWYHHIRNTMIHHEC